MIVTFIWLRKELLNRLAICSLRILAIGKFSYFPFGFEGGLSVLIASEHKGEVARVKLV